MSIRHRIKVLAGLFFLFLAGNVFSSELKVHFPFDEGLGTAMKDRVSGLVGKIYNTQWVDGKFGKALYFDGKKNECAYVDVLGSAKDSFLQTFDNQPFSITCWVKVDSRKNLPLPPEMEIMGTGSNDRGPGWRLRYFYEMVVFMSGDGKNFWSVASNPSLDKVALDDWTHIAVVKNKEGFLSLYLNGKKAAQSDTPFDVTSGNYPFTIGSFLGGFAGGFMGIIDEVKIYQGELTPEEIYRESQVSETTPPLTLDGNLDEPMWQNAQKVSPFYIHNSENQLASAQTTVFFTHDDRNLYFAFVCDEPKIGALKKLVTSNKLRVYRDDCIEVMIDADNNKADFYHILVNPLGYYGVELRSQGGEVASSVSNFRCFTGTKIEKDKWVVELAIPYSSFIGERIKSDIAFNCVRNRRVDLANVEESSCAQKGQFHKPDLFTKTHLTKANFDSYAFAISYPVVKDTTRKNDKVEVKLGARINNLSGTKKELLVSVGEEKLGKLSSVMVSLPPGEEQEMTFNFPVPRADTYQINLVAVSKDKQAVLYNGTFPVKITFLPVTLDVIEPFYRNSIYATEKITQLQVNCRIGLEEKEYDSGEIILTDSTNKEVASKTFPITQKEMLISLPIPQLADGKYKLVCRVMKAKNPVTEQAVVITKLPFAKGTEVRIDKNLNMVVNGKPVLPINWWGGSDLKEIAETGSDGIVTGFSRDNRPILDQLKALNQYGVIVLSDAQRAVWESQGQSMLSQKEKEDLAFSINLIKDHPALLCYYLSDEPECASIDPRILEESYNLIRNLDPYHPILICNSTVEGMRTYKDALDIFAPDPYVMPINDGTLTQGMTYVSTVIEEAKKIGEGKKGIWVTPQMFNFDEGGRLNSRAPTFTEERCMQYLAIIHGAKGFNYFIYYRAVKNPDLKLAGPYLIKEIKSLAPIILTGKEIKGAQVSNPDIHLLLKEGGGKLYLFACNVTDKPLEVEITMPAGTGEIKVVSEGRNVQIANNVFPDRFGPYAVHIYTTNLTFSDVVSLNKTKEEVITTGGIFEFKYR